MYKRILLTVDDSAPSSSALMEAARLTKVTGATLKALHIVHESIGETSHVPSNYDAVNIARRAAGERVLRDAGDELRQAGVEHERQLSEIIGITVAQEIVRQANAWSADLIIMGTHGRRGLSRLLMGSNAESVLRTSSVPVLLVRCPSIDTVQVAASGWYRRVLVPMDGSEQSLKGLEQALDCSQAAGAQIKAVHVLNILIPDGSVVPSMAYEPLLVNLRKKAAEVIASARAAAAKRDISIDAETIETVGGSTAQAILDAANRWSAELIVMGTHGRRGVRRLTMGSDAEDVVRAGTDQSHRLTRERAAGFCEIS